MKKLAATHLYSLPTKPVPVAAACACLMLMWSFSGCQQTGVLINQWGWEAVKTSLFTGVTSVWLVAFLLLFPAACLLNLYVSSRNQYKRLFRYNPTPMWIYDQKTLRKVAVNNAAIIVYGYTRKEFEGMHILDIVSPDDHVRVTAMAKEDSGGYNPRGTFELIKKTGERISVNITSHKIRFKRRKCVMVMCEDVTLQVLQDKKLQLLHRAEQEYKEELESKIKQLNETLQEKQRLAEVIDRIHNMVIITDTAGVINWVNEAFIQTTGYTLKEAMGKTMDFLRGPQTDPEMQDKIMKSLKNDDFSTFEVVNYSKAGSGYWVEMTISAVHNEKNEVVRYIFVQNIVTSRKLRDIQITEQNTVLKKLAWTNSHLVRKPIASVLGLVELGKRADNVEELREIQALIEVCSIELDNITKEVATEIYSRNFEGFTSV